MNYGCSRIIPNNGFPHPCYTETQLPPLFGKPGDWLQLPPPPRDCLPRHSRLHRLTRGRGSGRTVMALLTRAATKVQRRTVQDNPQPLRPPRVSCGPPGLTRAAPTP
ncbi:hypothetical protein E2C01_000407 [Portunus trituberculatus]|uniref:Uncharacterized protein n=1 Tax=Portunus trituberculatus TaxID=210409 RepID=A0A5B7CF47_PORTR|nr:hypothetical protein [Portunus trituberculatus]